MPESFMSATPVLLAHHKHCDDLFAGAEAAAYAGHWAACRDAFQRFSGEMTAHFATEEEVLFPAFETATGNTGGPTSMMRLEHAQMNALMTQAAQAAVVADSEGFSGAVETLLILMQQHNMKEENILYPMCDRALAGRELGLDRALALRVGGQCPA
jgi:iron-sulfur cluster repair protein YtfE (RIC family)